MAARRRAKGSTGPIRLLIYSHDGFGPDHHRRLVKLSTFLRQELPESSILLITGSSMCHTFRIPPGVDYVKLPCVSKESNEVYSAKYLSLTFEEIKEIRERIVLETALAYRPHVFLVDKHPLGMRGEVLPALRALKEHQRETKVVLGIHVTIYFYQAQGEVFERALQLASLLTGPESRDYQAEMIAAEFLGTYEPVREQTGAAK